MENSVHAERRLKKPAIARNMPVRDTIIPTGINDLGRNRVMKIKAMACQPAENT